MNPIFIYRHRSTGELRAEYLAQAQTLEDSQEWEHLKTVEPAAYVLHLQVENAELRKQLAAAERLNNHRDNLVSLWWANLPNEFCAEYNAIDAAIAAQREGK